MSGYGRIAAALGLVALGSFALPLARISHKRG